MGFGQFDNLPSGASLSLDVPTLRCATRGRWRANFSVDLVWVLQLLCKLSRALLYAEDCPCVLPQGWTGSAAGITRGFAPVHVEL